MSVRLTFFRVYSGTLDSGSYVSNSTKGKRERIGRILQMHANHREEISTVYAGDIAAAVGLKDTGQVTHYVLKKTWSFLESMEFPEPVISVAIEPKTKADQDKMGIALRSYKKKTQHSEQKQTQKQVRQLLLVWESSIWKSLLTV